MQGKDWESKNKRREKTKKVAEAKRARRKNKTEEKRKTNLSAKPKMGKVNGKNKAKQIKKK